MFCNESSLSPFVFVIVRVLVTIIFLTISENLELKLNVISQDF